MDRENDNAYCKSRLQNRPQEACSYGCAQVGQPQGDEDEDRDGGNILRQQNGEHRLAQLRGYSMLALEDLKNNSGRRKR